MQLDPDITSSGRSVGTVRTLGRLATGALAVLAFTACSDAGSSVTATSAPITGVLVLDTTTVAPSSTTTVAPVAAPDVNALLAPWSSGYGFTTTVTINGQVTVNAVGRHLGDGTALTVTGGGVPVDQIVVPTGTWAKSTDGTWAQVADPTASADPLAALHTPSSAVAAADGTVQATYPAEAFGLPPGSLPVVFTIAGDRIESVRFDTTVSGQPANVVTVFAALTDSTPITAPA
jgi:hypothetical protein